jgi:putative oxidoreductase
MLKTVLSPFSERAYAALRIVSGGLLALAGMGKIFGLFGQHAMRFSDNKQIFIGGLIEIVGGLAITFGLFARCAAFVCSGMMAVAYWQFHVFASKVEGFPKFLPNVNQGMPAVLLCFIFLYVACRGAGPWSIDAKREKAGTAS